MIKPLEDDQLPREVKTYRFLIALGAAPFILVILSSLPAFFEGYNFMGSKASSRGFEALYEYVFLLIILMFPLFLIAFVLLVIGIVLWLKDRAKTKRS